MAPASKPTWPATAINRPTPPALPALRDGWRLIQASPLVDHGVGDEFRTGYLKYEFFFEQWVEVDDA